jgi:uncharacterized protein YggU (UPF0235/DUF167 family)
LTRAGTLSSLPWTVLDGGIRLRVHLTPKAARDGVDGIGATPEGQALKVRVRALPEKGAANAALAGVVAEWLGVPKTRIETIAGGKSRLKTLFIAGDGQALSGLLAERLGKGSQGTGDR